MELVSQHGWVPGVAHVHLTNKIQEIQHAKLPFWVLTGAPDVLVPATDSKLCADDIFTVKLRNYKRVSINTKLFSRGSRKEDGRRVVELESKAGSTTPAFCKFCLEGGDNVSLFLLWNLSVLFLMSSFVGIFWICPWICKVKWMFLYKIEALLILILNECCKYLFSDT